MRSDVLVYLSGPITPAHGYTVEQNATFALTVYYDCLRAGIPAFCPHAAALDPASFAIDCETWMAYDFAMIDRCTHMLMLPRWAESKGAIREANYATLRGMCVFYDLDALVRHLDGKSRDEAQACEVVLDASGRLIAPPQTEPPARPDGPWRENGK